LIKALICSVVLISLVARTPATFAQSESSAAQLRNAFAHPPDDCRIMMRWWWFGPAVSKSEIDRELQQMKAAGIGGVEIATLYPLALDDPQTGFRNLPFLSDDHIDALRFAADQARKLGMRVDITLGSGWPFGDPHIPVTEAAGRMRVEIVAVPSGAHSIAIPNLGAGEQLLAIFLAPQSGDRPDYKQSKQIPLSAIENGRLQNAAEISPPAGAIFFISSRTGMMVKRAAVGAEGFVLDHYDQHAIATHLHAVGDRLLEAFGDHPPYAIFSDSLEDEGSDWTADFLEQFRKRRGYDLTPHLPALVGEGGPDTAAIRHDWGKTLTELANEHFLAPLRAWAQQHHTLLRSQTYGTPPVTLSSNRFVDLPEGEGKATLLMWRQFSDTRWAASAGHLFAKSVVSSETWTWLHSPAFRATPLDMKAEADLHFLQGINQLVGHGWPFSPASAGEPGWRMYAAGAFNAHNPWWFVIPDLTAYLQRVSFALRQGKPANDVALLLPNDDAWARFNVDSNSSSPASVSIDDSMPALLGNKIIPQILDSGFTLDFIDADAIDTIGIPYPILVLPGVDRLPLSTYRKVEQYARLGGIVIATRRLPSSAPGFLNAASETPQIQEISQRLFRDPNATAHFVEDEEQLGRKIATYAKPDVVFSPQFSQIGFVHRHLSQGDLYFLTNTSNHAVRTRARFDHRATNAEWWDPFTGQISPIDNAREVDLALQPYESRLIFFTNAAINGEPQPIPAQPSKSIDLSSGWNLIFNGSRRPMHMATLHSWSDEEPYYSGQVKYEKMIDLPPDANSTSSLILDFGEGVPVAIPDPLPEFNMRAYLESPVREAAEVYVNGQRAGVAWHPPYTIDLTPVMKPGKNQLRIVVGNTAINSMAGRALPDYRLLNDRYGERFVPQDMDRLKPLPSGILGGLRLKIFPH
jgi:hypothetical protein